MNHIKMIEDLLSDKLFMEESMSFHDSYPALYSGEMDIQDTDCEEFIKDKIEMIFHKSRDRWSGLKNLSFCYGIDSVERKLKYSLGVSSHNLSFSVYVLDFIKRFLPKLESSDDLKLQSEDETEEEDLAIKTNKHKVPAELVQINADSKTVKCWIDSFIRSRREIVNKQNIKEFCLPPEKRQNCARVDAVSVKRKDTSSHIRVEHVSNLWGPEIRSEFSPLKNKPAVDEHNYSVTKRTYQTADKTSESPKKKKVYSSVDVATKLEELKRKYASSSS